MKISGYFVALSLVSLVFVAPGTMAADRDLGQKLPYKTDVTGKPVFGSVYTYGDDPDGLSYLFNYSPNVDSSTAAKSFRWNFYLRSTDSFLLDWSAQRTTFAAVIQVKVGDEAGTLDPVVKQMLSGQKKVDSKGQLFFVLAGDDNVPVFNVPISDLCADFPSKFKDLTYGKKCDQISP